MADDDTLPEITVTAKAYPPPPPRGSARQPRCLIRVNGKAIAGCVNFSVSNNSFDEADSYHLTFAIAKLPNAYNDVWFADQTETFIEILAGFPTNPDNPASNELTSFIYGRVDTLEYDPLYQTLTLSGRDLTGAFIDAKIAAEYTNKTSSQIATILAQAHGLQTQITPTSTIVGTYYSEGTVQVHAGQSEWDVLSTLARQEGFVVLVRGQTLYFGPDTTGTGNPLVLTFVAPTVLGGAPSANFSSINFTRNQTIAKGISVTVMSAGVGNPTVKRSYPVAPKGITPGKGSPYGPTTNYTKIIPPGATPFQVEARAEAIYNEIIQHAMKLKVRMPADVITSPQSTLQMKGTGTAFDQTYYPRVVTRSMSVAEGFTMDIDAQNTSPNLTQAE